jgi:hypothetical protein
MGLFSVVKWFAAGYIVRGMLTQANSTSELPRWWPDVMLRAFASDQIAPKPVQLSQVDADAAGQAASAAQVPIGWLYELLGRGMEPVKLPLAASLLQATAKNAGPPADATASTLLVYRAAVIDFVAKYVLAAPQFTPLPAK